MARKKANIRNNKVLLLLLGVLILCFILLGFVFYKYFYSGNGNGKYGDRLDGIESYELSESLESDIQSVYSTTTSVEKVNVTVEGKIIYITMDFNTALTKADAQNLAIKSLDKIGEKNLTFYDVQIILTLSSEEENSNFPMFGAKSASSNKVVW